METLKRIEGDYSTYPTEELNAIIAGLLHGGTKRGNTTLVAAQTVIEQRIKDKYKLLSEAE